MTERTKETGFIRDASLGLEAVQNNIVGDADSVHAYVRIFVKGRKMKEIEKMFCQGGACLISITLIQS